MDDRMKSIPAVAHGRPFVNIVCPMCGTLTTLMLENVYRSTADKVTTLAEAEVIKGWGRTDCCSQAVTVIINLPRSEQLKRTHLYAMAKIDLNLARELKDESPEI